MFMFFILFIHKRKIINLKSLYFSKSRPDLDQKQNMNGLKFYFHNINNNIFYITVNNVLNITSNSYILYQN